MYKTKTKTFEKEVIESITCDICGETFTDIMELNEFFQVDETCGYGSIFGDGNRIQLDVCQRCLKEKFGDKIRIRN